MSSSKHTPRGSESANWRARTPSSDTTPLNASAPAFAPPTSSAQALVALLASGPVRINLTAERESRAASSDRPLFLKGVKYNPIDTRTWYEQVLPYLSKCTFIVSSTSDVTYSGSIFGSAALPHIYNAITKVELPKFYWFSGVALNRHHNPYMQMCRNLPNLQELSLTFHTAGLTNQRWSERQIVALEQKNPEAARERILLPLRDVVDRYELDALFACSGLSRLRLNYIESDMTAYFCKVGSPLDVLGEVQMHLHNGFAQRSVQVVIQLLRVKDDILGSS